MNPGKDICGQLKAIRRTIAQENDIQLEIPECTFKGNCSGTCPQCESEVKYLENELAKRISLGKAATVAGIALALASPAAAQEVGTRDAAADSATRQQKVLTEEDIAQLPTVSIMGAIKATSPQAEIIQQEVLPVIRGVVVDSSTRAPLVFASADVEDAQGNTLAITTTNAEGQFELKEVTVWSGCQLAIRKDGFQSIFIPIAEFKELQKQTANPTFMMATGKMWKITGMPNTGHRLRKEDVAQSTIPFQDQRGVYLYDSKTQKPIPFAKITLLGDEDKPMVVETDIDGRWIISLKQLPSMKYNTMIVNDVGYQPATIVNPIEKMKKGWLVIGIEASMTGLMQVVITGGDMNNMIDAESSGLNASYERDGLKVKVQY